MEVAEVEEVVVAKNGGSSDGKGYMISQKKIETQSGVEAAEVPMAARRVLGLETVFDKSGRTD